ncbi:MAG: cupin domain-containing protein [Arenimonas sp.]
MSLNTGDKKPTDNNTGPVAVIATEVQPRSKKSLYPEPFASRMRGREKRVLGDLFGLTNFGVNITRLSPSAVSALRHAHSKQDEFIYILQGNPTLISDEGETPLSPGMCAGFKAGTGNAHQLVNGLQSDAVYLEIGDRTPNDSAIYPDDDLQALMVDGQWQFLHKDGRRYDTNS